MPRIPHRTEPYASPFRQHRHYKSKRDIILKALGKSSYINGSQFAVLFISARGDVEAYASELLQDVVSLPRVDGAGAAEAGGAGEGAPTSIWREEVVRAKKDFVQRTGERRRQEVQEKRGLLGASTQRESGNDEHEGAAGGSESDEDGEGSPSRDVFRPAPASSLQLQSRTGTPGQDPDATLVDEGTAGAAGDHADFLPAVKLEPSAFHLSTPLDKPTWHARGNKAKASVDLTHGTRGLQDRIADTPRRAERERLRKERADRGDGDEGGDDEDDSTQMHPAVTPARNAHGRPASISLSAFKTPAPPTARTVTGHRASQSVELQRAQAGAQAEGGVARRPMPPANADAFMASTPIRPADDEASAPFVPETVPAPAAASTSAQAEEYVPAPGSAPAAAPTTHVLEIPIENLSDYLIERFNALQQTTCKLVVKTWIKVVEPKKQTRYPYNKGEASKPAWWPEGVRHREPDHLMKPERTQLLLAILRHSTVPAIRLELSTAEMSAYISQSKMKILREVYAVAKEEQRRRGTQETGNLMVRLNGSPVDVKAPLPSSTPDPSRLASSQLDSPAVHHTQSARKRKGAEAAEADKENAQASSSQGVPSSMPFGSLKLKRARANSTLETYGNGHGEQVSPLRRLSNMNISTPFSGSPLIRGAQPDGAYAHPGSNQGSPYLPAQYSPAMLPTWSTGNTSSPIHPGAGFQVYPVAGPGPAMTESLKKRTQQRPTTMQDASRPSSASVSRLPLPSLQLPPQQDHRPFVPAPEYWAAAPAESPVMMPTNQPVFYAAMPQHGARNMGYIDPQLGDETPMSHSPFLVATPIPPPVSSLASYPYGMQGQHDMATRDPMQDMYDTYAPMSAAGSAASVHGMQGNPADGMFAFTPTLAGEQTEVAEDEYVWAQGSQ